MSLINDNQRKNAQQDKPTIKPIVVAGEEAAIGSVGTGQEFQLTPEQEPTLPVAEVPEPQQQGALDYGSLTEGAAQPQQAFKPQNPLDQINAGSAVDNNIWKPIESDRTPYSSEILQTQKPTLYDNSTVRKNAASLDAQGMAGVSSTIDGYNREKQQALAAEAKIREQANSRVENTNIPRKQQPWGLNIGQAFNDVLFGSKQSQQEAERNGVNPFKLQYGKQGAGVGGWLKYVLSTPLNASVAVAADLNQTTVDALTFAGVSKEQAQRFARGGFLGLASDAILGKERTNAIGRTIGLQQDWSKTENTVRTSIDAITKGESYGDLNDPEGNSKGVFYRASRQRRTQAEINKANEGAKGFLGAGGIGQAIADDPIGAGYEILANVLDPAGNALGDLVATGVRNIGKAPKPKLPSAKGVQTPAIFNPPTRAQRALPPGKVKGTPVEQQLEQLYGNKIPQPPLKPGERRLPPAQQEPLLPMLPGTPPPGGFVFPKVNMGRGIPVTGTRVIQPDAGKLPTGATRKTPTKFVSFPDETLEFAEEAVEEFPERLRMGATLDNTADLRQPTLPPAKFRPETLADYWVDDSVEFVNSSVDFSTSAATTATKAPRIYSGTTNVVQKALPPAIDNVIGVDPATMLGTPSEVVFRVGIGKPSSEPVQFADEIVIEGIDDVGLPDEALDPLMAAEEDEMYRLLLTARDRELTEVEWRRVAQLKVASEEGVTVAELMEGAKDQVPRSREFWAEEDEMNALRLTAVDRELTQEELTRLTYLKIANEEGVTVAELRRNGVDNAPATSTLAEEEQEMQALFAKGDSVGLTEAEELRLDKIMDANSSGMTVAAYAAQRSQPIKSSIVREKPTTTLEEFTERSTKANIDMYAKLTQEQADGTITDSGKAILLQYEGQLTAAQKAEALSKPAPAKSTLADEELEMEQLSTIGKTRELTEEEFSRYDKLASANASNMTVAEYADYLRAPKQSTVNARQVSQSTLDFEANAKAKARRSDDLYAYADLVEQRKTQPLTEAKERKFKQLEEALTQEDKLTAVNQWRESMGLEPIARASAPSAAADAPTGNSAFDAETQELDALLLREENGESLTPELQQRMRTLVDSQAAGETVADFKPTQQPPSVVEFAKDKPAVQTWATRADQPMQLTWKKHPQASGKVRRVNPQELDKLWRTDRVEKGGGGGIGKRYEESQEFIRGNSEPIIMSEVTMQKDGSLVFTDGRHRFANLRDMGFTEIPIVVRNSKYLPDEARTITRAADDIPPPPTLEQLEQAAEQLASHKAVVQAPLQQLDDVFDTTVDFGRKQTDELPYVKMSADDVYEVLENSGKLNMPQEVKLLLAKKYGDDIAEALFDSDFYNLGDLLNTKGIELEQFIQDASAINNGIVGGKVQAAKVSAPTETRAATIEPKPLANTIKMPAKVLHGTALANWSPDYNIRINGSRGELGTGLYVTNRQTVANDYAQAFISENASPGANANDIAPSVYELSNTFENTFSARGKLGSSSPTIKALISSLPEQLQEPVRKSLTRDSTTSYVGFLNKVEASLVRSGLSPDESTLKSIGVGISDKLRELGYDSVYDSKSGFGLVLDETKVSVSKSKPVSKASSPTQAALARYNADAYAAKFYQERLTTDANLRDSAYKLLSQVESTIDDKLQEIQQEIIKRGLDKQESILPPKQTYREGVSLNDSKPSSAQELMDTLEPKSTNPCEL